MDAITLMNKLGLNVEVESFDAKNGIIKGIKISTSYEITDPSYKISTEAMTSLLQQGLAMAKIAMENEFSRAHKRDEIYAKEAELSLQREQERIRYEKAQADCEELRKQKLEVELKEKLKK